MTPRSRTLGCSAEYDALLECATSVEDVCNPGDACMLEIQVFSECYSQTCSDNPDEPACG